MAGKMAYQKHRPIFLLAHLIFFFGPFSLGLPAAEAALAATRRLQQPPQTSDALSPRDGSVEEAARSSPLRVAQCRARCLQRFSGATPSKDAVCMQAPDCFVCWENCELLQSNYAVWGRMCKQKSICFPGCQQACKFHREQERGPGDSAEGDAAARQNVEPVVQTLGHRVVEVVQFPARRGVLVRWPPYSRSQSAGSVVYVVMTKEAGALFWTQVTQTVDLEARLADSTSSVGGLGIRVLVVDPEGLVTVYSPSTDDDESPIPTSTVGPSPVPPGSEEEAEAATKGGGDGERDARAGRWPLVIRDDVDSPLDSAQLALLFPTASAEEAASQLAVRRSAPGSPWVLREVSLIHQRVLVIAEVSWEARGWVYLVTWEVDGGGWKGNLFTQSTSVTLSLWPDTLFHIQVEVVSRTPGDSRPPDRSQVLHLDTRRAAPVVLANDHQTGDAELPEGPSPTAQELTKTDEEEVESGVGIKWVEGEVLAGSGAAIAFFCLILLFVLARRRRRANNCQSYSEDNPKHASWSPPVAELKEEPESWKAEDQRDAFYYLFRPLVEALSWVGHGAKKDRPTGHPGHPFAKIPTVSGTARHKGLQPSLQHPEQYADAFLREAERGAGNEVQV
ncbi:uncharacterized protein LOC124161148 [Ischnura elegans]|uniref:uncharacterized protein LOC124161148 n=1 Tax=Ischnura elegans TaxID=197161 RepID=UPI001ED8954F|nr:uncharacterized protein LOC124161148 [Ischnura elegans]